MCHPATHRALAYLALLGLLVPGLAASCASPPAAALGERWAAADALFTQNPRWQNPRWLGADAAFSVDLGDDRVLWLFGDTFVGRTPTSDRRDSVMVRNTVGVQVGRDPVSARASMHWREAGGAPSAFFPAVGDGWVWPLHGIVVDGALTVFLAQIAASEGGLGFTPRGWSAVRVADPTLPADTWSLAPLTGCATPLPMIVGVAVLEHDEHILAYAVAEPGDHAAYLLRWPRAAFVAGELSTPEWWSAGRWGGEPSIVIPNAATEFSVHALPDGRWLQVQSVGFGSTEIGWRLADRPQGPWSAPRSVFRPAESDRKGAFVYAAKAHPELAERAVIVTYVANAWDFGELVQDMSLYWPRFVRLPLPE